MMSLVYVCLTFLQLSIPIHRLNSWFGINGCVLSCVTSYLSNRSLYVNLTGGKSSVFQLLYGFLKDLFFDLFSLSSILLHSVISFQNLLQIIISMLMTPNFTCLSLPLISPPILLILKTLLYLSVIRCLLIFCHSILLTEFLLIGQPRQLAKIDHPTISHPDNVKLS
jgi:hypothetical protein